jgi:putative FmdB family regulatory protein
MPTYEYECDACGHRFDQFQSITASALRKCPKCGRQKLRRLIGVGGAVIFKGGGFYETDYRSEGYRKAEEAERKSGETKPDAKGGDSKGSGEATTTKTDAASKAESPKAAEAKPAESTAPKSRAPEKPASKVKSHAREGRGVGNLKRGAAKPTAKKQARRPRG